MNHPQIENHLAGFVKPTHARAFEALREHRLAGCLSYAAADRQATSPIVWVIHEPAMTAHIVVRLPELRPLGLRHAATPQQLHRGAQYLGRSLRSFAQPTPHLGKP